MSTYTPYQTLSATPTVAATLRTHTPLTQPSYMHPLNLTQEQYKSLRDLIKSQLTLDSPGLRGAQPPHLHTFNSWFVELMESKIVPAFFSDEEGAYWERNSILIARAVRTCVLRISTAMRRNAGVKEYLRCTAATSNQPVTTAPMEAMNPCYIGDAANQQVQDDDFYPEARALSPEECWDSLGGFEEYMDGEGGDVEGYFSMSNGEFALEFFQDEGFAFSDITMEGGEYGSSGSSGNQSFPFGAEGGVV